MTTVRLLPSEQRVVDALAARGLTLGDALEGRLLLQVAQELHLARVTVETHIAKARGKMRAAGLLVRRAGVTRGSDTGHNASTDAEAREIRTHRRGTRAMLLDELRRLGNDVERGGSRQELLQRLRTLQAWVEIL